MTQNLRLSPLRGRLDTLGSEREDLHTSPEICPRTRPFVQLGRRSFILVFVEPIHS